MEKASIMTSIGNTEVIKITELYRSFGKNKVLNGIDLTINKGDFVGLIGPNGVGKTTLIRHMLGCLKPDSGNIIVMGENIGGVQHRGINRKIGFVLDHHGFSPDLSAFANLLYYGRLQGFRKPDIIKRTKELMDSLGIELDLNNTIRAYSKGMLQQLAIIRALLHRPSLLILDKVLSGLDPQMRILLINALYQLVKTEKVTILISSHELNAIEDLCSRFLLFNKGRLDEITQKENKEFEETWQLFLYGKRHESFRKDNIPDWLNKFGPDYEEAKHRISIRCLDYKSVLRAIDQIEPQVSDINKIEIRRYNLEDIFLKNTGNKDVDFTQSNIY